MFGTLHRPIRGLFPFGRRGLSADALTGLMWHPGVVSTGEDLVDDGVVLFLLVVAVASGVASMKIAEAKGHNGTGYFFLGLLLPLIGILVAGFMPEGDAANRPGGMGSESPLVELRPRHQQEAERFISAFASRLRRAHGACESGERVLAYGTGVWDDREQGVGDENGRKYGFIPSSILENPLRHPTGRGVVFLLTNQRMVLVGLATESEVTTVADLHYVRLDENEGALAFSKGAFTPGVASPFNVVELESLVRHREWAEPFVEVVHPGDLSLSAHREPGRPSSSEEERDMIGELERLDALHRSGAIDDAEFAELKRRAMWGDDGPTESNDQTG